MSIRRFTQNHEVNRFIEYCFQFIGEEDRRKFANTLLKHNLDPHQLKDAFCELILGSFLGSKGLCVRHDHRVGNKTPDWCIFDGQDVTCIIELTNYHLDKETQDEISNQRGNWQFYAAKPNDQRVHDRIYNKTVKYKDIVDKLQVAYAVVLFPDFYTYVDRKEITANLFDSEYGIFVHHTHLSGLLYVSEISGTYAFNYVENPYATRPFALPTGTFPDDQRE